MTGAEAFAKDVAAMIAEELKKGVPQKELYTLEEAATFLACSLEQMRRFMNTKEVPCVKIDSRPRFQVKELQRFIERSKE